MLKTRPAVEKAKGNRQKGRRRAPAPPPISIECQLCRQWPRV